MPTRLTRVMPPPAGEEERVSAQTTPYCSPEGASRGTAMVTVAIACPPGGTLDAPGRTDVQVDNSLGVCAAAPTNAPCLMAAAAGYMTMCRLEAVVLEISIRRWLIVPGC